jgi:hypothetical protein
MGPWPPGKKMAANSSARPRKDDSCSVFSQVALCSARKDCETWSFLKASTEDGSRGAAPPRGEAKERWKPWRVRTS